MPKFHSCLSGHTKWGEFLLQTSCFYPAQNHTFIGGKNEHCKLPLKFLTFTVTEILLPLRYPTLKKKNTGLKAHKVLLYIIQRAKYSHFGWLCLVVCQTLLCVPQIPPLAFPISSSSALQTHLSPQPSFHSPFFNWRYLLGPAGPTLKPSNQHSMIRLVLENNTSLQASGGDGDDKTEPFVYVFPVFNKPPWL